MHDLGAKFDKMVLVCLNQRTDGRACCADKGSAEVHARLKQWVRDQGLAGRIRVSKTGCLDHCAQGTAVVVLPEFRWYGGVTVEDVDQIINQHLLELSSSSDPECKEKS